MVSEGAEGPWVRGVVRAVTPHKEEPDALYKVEAVDYGSIYTVYKCCIKRYPDSLKAVYTSLPALAIPCRMSGIDDRENRVDRGAEMRELLHLQDR